MGRRPGARGERECVLPSMESRAAKEKGGV